MTPEPTPTVAPDDSIARLIAGLSTAIGSSVASAVAATQPPRQLTPAQYDPKTTAHPNKKLAEKFTRVSKQNGRTLDWDTTTDPEIRYLNRLTHSGWYLDNLVEVLVERQGQTEYVDIRFKNATMSQQLALAHKCTDFADMLRQIVKVQEEEDLDDQTRPEPKRRHFGDNKAMREAQARAGAV